MSASQPQIYCPNLNCSAPLNDFGCSICANCQTPLIHRYLWAVAVPPATQPAVGTLVAGRYYVQSAQTWLDTQPGLLPDFPTAELPDELLPYLYLYPYRLHVPEVYGICPTGEAELFSGVFFLENAAFDREGNLYPSIGQAWSQATAVRQVYWLWQILQLWMPLLEQGVASSLLATENMRVEGWRVRLCQLFQDHEILQPEASAESSEIAALTLADLANLWLTWLERAKPTIAQRLQEICLQMQTEGVDIREISAKLNRLLLEQAAQLPLRLQILGVTDTGPQHQHNEDTCYPLASDKPATSEPPPTADETIADLTPEPPAIVPGLAIVCDGIGGHEGGEVASQLAVQSLKVQIQALLNEMATQTELVTPDVIAEQLEAIVRIVNNLIAAQNDAQGRESRRRMGTTLVMALQLPQKVTLPKGRTSPNSHELYLVQVGDSRAYWLTQRHCRLLTVDDDVAAREVRTGRMLYREGLQRPDAGALTQALGTRDSEFLHPTVQRFVIEEDGILLLCSDGLSDNGWVEAAWAEVTEPVLKGKKSLEAAAQDWIELANRNNGHDNVSVVLCHCHVSTPLPEISLIDAPKLEPQPEA
ncbi:MAG TPA: PP2C family serine/threonine-protein phosphatase, partial [Microcoleaceae cyanobacterium]